MKEFVLIEFLSASFHYEKRRKVSLSDPEIVMEVILSVKNILDNSYCLGSTAQKHHKIMG